MIIFQQFTNNNENGNEAGKVQVYSWVGSAWTQRGSDIEGEVAGDYSGWSIGISSDGKTLAIGGGDNDGSDVRIYRFDWPVGVESIATSPIRIYPNPSNGNYTLNLGQIHEEIELIVMDVRGQIVLTKRVESASQIHFELIGNSGVYFVKIGTNEGVLSTVKVIKE